MPELPEVESTVRGLIPLIVGRRITGVWSDAPKLVRNGSFKKMEDGIKGRKIESVSRRAKNILIHLEGGFLLLIHLKMTGHLMVGKWNIPKKGGRVEPDSGGALTDKVNGYVHFIFFLDDGRMMALSDLRKFAKISFGEAEEIEKKEKLAKIGPEANVISLSELRSALKKGSKRSIKSVLMDQEKIAGIGNIYSDDILWKSEVHPLRPASSLSDGEINVLYKSIKDILALAIKLKGTSISDYRDVHGEKGGYGERRLVYRRDGEPCPHCGTPIKKLKVGSRSGRFCPRCQIV